MRLGVVRSTVVLIAATASLVLPGVSGAGTAALQLDRGVVQSITGTQIELRALDGAVLSLAIGPATRLRLNGAPANLAQIRPGFVAEVLHRGARPAVAVRAFGTVPILVDRGVVTSLSRMSITVRTDAGTAVTIPLDAATRFRRLGRPVVRAAARAGARVAVRHPEGGPARLVTVLRLP
jgi:hypothetical protein